MPCATKKAPTSGRGFAVLVAAVYQTAVLAIVAVVIIEAPCCSAALMHPQAVDVGNTLDDHLLLLSARLPFAVVVAVGRVGFAEPPISETRSDIRVAVRRVAELLQVFRVFYFFHGRTPVVAPGGIPGPD